MGKKIEVKARTSGILGWTRRIKPNAMADDEEHILRLCLDQEVSLRKMKRERERKKLRLCLKGFIGGEK